MFEGYVDETPLEASTGAAGVVPGPELADRLLAEELLAPPEADPADHSPAGEAAWLAAESEGLGRIEGWSRMTAWVQAQEMMAVEALVTRAVERAEQRPHGTPSEEHAGGVSAEVDSVVAELALTWRVAQRTATRRVDEAVSLVNGLPLLIEAMLDGRLGLAHVRALGGVLLDLDPVLCERICRDLLEATPAGAPIARTPAQLGASARRAAIRLDPGSARRRERAAARERGVHLGAEDHGMATVTAYLPAAEALLLYRTIDAHARRSAPADPRELASPGDPADEDGAESAERSPDARRADALCDLVGLGALLAAGAQPQPSGDIHAPDPNGAQTPARGGCEDSAPVTNAEGAAERPDAERPDPERTDAGRTDSEPTDSELTDSELTDSERAGVEPHEAAGDEPSGGSAASEPSPCICPPRTRGLDHHAHGSRDRIAESSAPRPDPDTGDHRPGRPSPRRRPPRPPGTVQVRVVVSADTLLGLDDHPAELVGYGPITAAAARALAADTDATWRRVLTDPASGTVLDVGHRRYRPPAAMAEYVRNRDLTCTFPGCRVPAQACDLDHLVPWDPRDPDGRTAADNLDPDCRHHHVIKHLPGWTVARGPGGSVIWTTPTGRRYRTIRPVLMPATYDADDLAPNRPSARAERDHHGDRGDRGDHGDGRYDGGGDGQGDDDPHGDDRGGGQGAVSRKDGLVQMLRRPARTAPTYGYDDEPPY